MFLSYVESLPQVKVLVTYELVINQIDTQVGGATFCEVGGGATDTLTTHTCLGKQQ